MSKGRRRTQEREQEEKNRRDKEEGKTQQARSTEKITKPNKRTGRRIKQKRPRRAKRKTSKDEETAQPQSAKRARKNKAAGGKGKDPTICRLLSLFRLHWFLVFCSVFSRFHACSYPPDPRFSDGGRSKSSNNWFLEAGTDKDN